MSVDFWIVGLRGLHVAALMSWFGTLLFTARLGWLRLDPAFRLRRALWRLGRVSAALAIIAGAVWLVMEARVIAGAGGIGETVSAVGLVAVHTQFGSWLLLRLGLIAASLLGARVRGLALALAGVALAVQPALAHAGAIGGGTGLLLTGSEALHLLAAGAWLGGLLPLAMSVRMLPSGAIGIVGRRFSRLALAAVLVLAVTGLVQGSVLVGGVAGLMGTLYGHALSIKLGLFLCALAIGAVNRFVLIPVATVSLRARHRLRLAVIAEAAIGLCIVLTAGWLASLAPAGTVQAAWWLWGRRAAMVAAAAFVAVRGAFSMFGRVS